MVVVAPIYELDGECRFNTAVVIDDQGTVLGRYRKIHIPGGSNEQGSFEERFYYAPSNGDLEPTKDNISENPYFPVFATRFGNLGIATCYDRHFEGVMRTLAQEGAELVFSPAVTFGQKSRRLWTHEFLTDAARHTIFIGGSNRDGREPPWNVEFFGESFFLGPDGPLQNLSDHKNLIIADLDLQRLAEPDSSGWNLARDARPETHSPHAEWPPSP